MGPLHGIPVGIKDIIHVEGFKTEFNCKAFKNTEISKLDSGVVLALRSAGAIILGKTHTTEFAFYDPSPARNPHNPNHTPGGSSSGSGSSVASGTVPMSVGTQTMASVNRPAIYCGISAFKPTNGLITTYGISPLAPSFDTPGFYGWSIADACYGYNSVSLNDKSSKLLINSIIISPLYALFLSGRFKITSAIPLSFTLVNTIFLPVSYTHLTLPTSDLV